MKNKLDLTGPPTVPEILKVVLLFCEEYEIAETTFSKNVTGTTTLVHYLRKGRDIRLGTVHRIYDYMRQYEELHG
jgi:predicted transcriptional regulator